MPLSSAQIPRKPVSCGRVTQKVVPGCESWSIPDGLVLLKEDKLGQAVPLFTSASGPYIPQLVASGRWCLCLLRVCVTCNTHSHTQT